MEESGPTFESEADKGHQLHVNVLTHVVMNEAEMLGSLAALDDALGILREDRGTGPKILGGDGWRDDDVPVLAKRKILAVGKLGDSLVKDAGKASERGDLEPVGDSLEHLDGAEEIAAAGAVLLVLGVSDLHAGLAAVADGIHGPVGRVGAPATALGAALDVGAADGALEALVGGGLVHALGAEARGDDGAVVAAALGDPGAVADPEAEARVGGILGLAGGLDVVGQGGEHLHEVVLDAVEVALLAEAEGDAAEPPEVAGEGALGLGDDGVEVRVDEAPEDGDEGLVDLGLSGNGHVLVVDGGRGDLGEEELDGVDVGDRVEAERGLQGIGDALVEEPSVDLGVDELVLLIVHGVVLLVLVVVSHLVPCQSWLNGVSRMERMKGEKGRVSWVHGMEQQQAAS